MRLDGYCQVLDTIAFVLITPEFLGSERVNGLRLRLRSIRKAVTMGPFKSADGPMAVIFPLSLFALLLLPTFHLWRIMYRHMFNAGFVVLI